MELLVYDMSNTHDKKKHRTFLEEIYFVQEKQRGYPSVFEKAPENIVYPLTFQYKLPSNYRLPTFIILTCKKIIDS